MMSTYSKEWWKTQTQEAWSLTKKMHPNNTDALLGSKRVQLPNIIPPVEYGGGSIMTWASTASAWNICCHQRESWFTKISYKITSGWLFSSWSLVEVWWYSRTLIRGSVLSLFVLFFVVFSVSFSLPVSYEWNNWMYLCAQYPFVS